MKTTIFVCIAVTSVLVANANEFLKQPTHKLAERVSEEDIRVSLLEEVESSLGAGSASKRLSQMEVLLRPIVAALPKNQHGNMGHSAVRYALHRLFVLRHGWVITGLGAKDGLWNSSSPSGVLTDQVPAYIEALFEQRLAGKGFGLHEVAVLAATIEHLIHNEAVSRLGSTFNLYSLPVTSPLSEEEVAEVLDTYMMTFILGEHIQNMTLNLAKSLTTQMPEVFLAWKETQTFVHGIRANLTKTEGVGTDFASVARIAEEVGEHFGSFQDFECKDLKQKLVDMEYRGTGRVLLSDFYKPALNGAWTFQESVGYLRALGLLDESDADQPSVMIANYVTSDANCIASSGFYSVCCKNECEGLLGHLEDHFGAHEVEPSKIAAVVASLASSTVATPSISESLMGRLNDIAKGHGGKVPLHGRLFAQWMHHVYPRECPYPHMSGVAENKGAKQFMDESGTDATATEEEMMQYVTMSVNATQSEAHDLAVEDVSPWTSEEELFVSHSTPSKQSPWDRASSAPGGLRSAALLAASGSLAFALIQTIKAPMGALGESLPTKYVV